MKIMCQRQPLRLLLTTTTFGLTALLAVNTFADTQLISNGAPLKYLVPTSDALGGTWRNPGFNDSGWTGGHNGIGYEVNPGAFNASVIADSQGEFSTLGLQGANSWINGYYDRGNDPDATYQATDFQPFPRSEGPRSETNYWDGGAWNWYPDDIPWDTIGAVDVHPNGLNSGGLEHWVMRRWVSTASGAITIRFHLRKSNLSGTGVTGKIFKNGVELFTRAISGTDGTGYEVYVNTTTVPGDVFDFAQTPVGLSGDTGDGADGSIMTATILSGTIVPPPPPPTPATVADSAADWSSTGTQGENGWYYGFWNKTADADGIYDPNTDFNTTDPNWTFGGEWTLGPGDPPWDIIGQTGWHPNGDNNEHVDWVIRRWVSDVDGDLYTHVKFGKQNINGGNGTTLHILHQGTELYSQTVAFNNSAGIDVYVAIPNVFAGDKIDFALDPLGTDGTYADGADGSYINATIHTGPLPQTTVADSVNDWSATGVQGANGWSYGIYNETADPDHSYNPSTDFNTTDPNWTFGGGQWTLGPGDPPWDIIGQTDWHPNGDNNEHVDWVIRRWVSDVDGDLYTHVQFGKANINGGNGTTLRIFHGATQIYSNTVAFNNGAGIDVNVAIPGVLIGDTIEFALDPLGTDGSKGDGADGSFLRATIITGLPPEPPKPFVAGVGDCFQTDVESAMKGVNPSVFIRIPFDVANPSAIQTLKLKMKYNDGFAAYLNGKEIAKRNAPTSIAGSVVANSITDWSTNPDVVVNGWSYGYYDQSLDADGTYSGGSDLTPFPHDGTGVPSPTEFWVGNGYDWFNGNPPWTELFQEATHPAHPNGAVFDPANPTTHVLWNIRRWNSTVDADLKCRVRFRKLNTGCGDGVRVSVFHGSVQVYSQTIAGNDGVGRDDTIDLPSVFLGDNIDILLGPGDGNDYCDGSQFSAVIFEGEPAIPWNGAATGTRTPTKTITPEVLDITPFISELTPGQNILAIQGINAGISDNEFVINAQLLANQMPTAVNDSVNANTAVPTTYPASALLGNDSDPDGDHLLLVGVTPSYMTAQGGTVRLYGDTVRYTSAAAFTGVDTFEYTMTDVSGVPVRATVSVNVVANNCPTASPVSASVNQNGSVNIQLLGSDPDANPLQYIVTQAPAHGIVTLNVQTGAASYTPNANYSGSDSFKYKVSDGLCDSAEANVSITVQFVNAPPICAASVACALNFANDPNAYLIALNGANACTILDASQSSDPEGTALGFRWAVQPNPTPFAAGVTATNCFDLGCHVVTLTVVDSGGGTCTTNITVCVITACDAIGKCVDLVNGASVSRNNKQPLIATLKAACIAVDRQEFLPAIKQLEAFQRKVVAQLGRNDPAVAEALIDCVQRILDGIDCSARLDLGQ